MLHFGFPNAWHFLISQDSSLVLPSAWGAIWTPLHLHTLSQLSCWNTYRILPAWLRMPCAAAIALLYHMCGWRFEMSIILRCSFLFNVNPNCLPLECGFCLVTGFYRIKLSRNYCVSLPILGHKKTLCFPPCSLLDYSLWGGWLPCHEVTPAPLWPLWRGPMTRNGGLQPRSVQGCHRGSRYLHSKQAFV